MEEPTRKTRKPRTKTGKRVVQTSTALTPELVERLKKEAANKRISMSALLRRIVSEHYNKAA